MKIFYAFCTLALFIIYSCSKPTNNPKPESPQPDPEPEVVAPIDTSLAGRLNLKISDKEHLVLNKILFEDSKGNFIIEGKKADKHWIGCYDKDGKEIIYKTYVDVPSKTADVFDYLDSIPLLYNDYRQIIEINDDIFIVRQIGHNSIRRDRFYYIEDLTIINTKQKTFDVTIKHMNPNSPFITEVKTWFGDYYRIDQGKFDVDYGSLPWYVGIYNSSHQLVSEFEAESNENNWLDYLAISKTEVVFIRNTGILMFCNYENVDRSLRFNTFDEIAFVDADLRSGKVWFETLKLVDNVIEIQYYALNWFGGRDNRIARIDAKTRKLLSE